MFWDQEVWMLPAVLAFEPEMVNLVLSQSRFRRIAAAKQNAMKRGFKGAMFPWESAFSGWN